MYLVSLYTNAVYTPVAAMPSLSLQDLCGASHLLYPQQDNRD